MLPQALLSRLASFRFLAINDVQAEGSFVSPGCRLVSYAKTIYTLQHTRLICATGAEFRSARLALRTRWVKLENFYLERLFSFGTLHQWCRKFLSGIFTRFGRPMAENFDFVLSDQGVTISLFRYC